MAALLPDYEYDIFISYRHNDSKWMAEFITLLQNELRTIIKQPLSIYYDKDITDGLDDTALVGESLDHRVLSSIILIPLISSTYCDTARYSWQREFLPFLQQAKNDRLRLNLPLASGNVASRILPLRLHNLDLEDTQLLEKTLDGQLRSIDFVYQNLGVNRPLFAKDDDLPPSAGGVLYCDQINKVANNIKALIAAAVSKGQQSAAPAAPLPVAPAPAAWAPAAVPTAAPAPTGPVTAGAEAAPTGPVVFLAWTTKKMKARREELAQVCAKAGLHVVPTTDCPSDDDEFRLRTQEALASAVGALHLLGNDFGQCLDDDEKTSLPQYAYELARQQATGRPAFRQVVWHSPEPGTEISEYQQALVSKIRNELTEQCTFSSAASAPQLVQDLRSALAQAAPPPVSVEKGTDIYFVSNALDRAEAEAITDRLSEEFSLSLDMLTIRPDGDDAYKKKMESAIPRSKLAVVYYKHSTDWALPFVKQVWQLVGGAASPTPILFVGEDDPEQSCLQSFKAPKVYSRIRTHQEVSEEVQRIFQALT
jgi:hypothetical protein